MDDRTVIICATLCVVGMALVQLGETKGSGGHGFQLAGLSTLAVFGASKPGEHAPEARTGARLLLSGN